MTVRRRIVSLGAAQRTKHIDALYLETSVSRRCRQRRNAHMLGWRKAIFQWSSETLMGVKLTALQTARRSQGHCHWNHTLCRPGLGLIASVIYCVATEADPRVTIPSVDGIGTYDHILRSAMSGLTSMSGAKSMLPFVHIVRATFELPVVR